MVHEGGGDEKCPKDCPHGLWMVPKVGFSVNDLDNIALSRDDMNG